MRHRGYIPKRHREGAQGGDREPALEAGTLRWCPAYTTPSLIGFPKPLVWKENTHLRCHGHPQKGSLAAAYPFSAAYGGFLRNSASGLLAYFLLPTSHREVCLLGRMLWQNQFCWPEVCSMCKWESQFLFQRQCGECLRIRFKA